MKRNQAKIYLLTFLSVVGLWSCTDLEIEETDSIITEGFQGLADPSSTVDELYNRLLGQRQNQGNLFALSEVTTDAALIPTRGTDWGDNGLWRVLHTHDWNSEHDFINGVWNDYNGNQLIASQVLDSRSNPSAQNIGEASFIRAYSMWVILDNFGQVPFRDVTLPSSALPEVLSGQAAYDFIIADLDQAISNLPTIPAGGGEEMNRAGKAAARYLKAKLLLNKHIYLGGSPDPADMTQVISLVDDIAADGFALQAGFFELFRNPSDFGGNSEVIWSTNSGPAWMIFNGLHYNHSLAGWNGFSTLAEYYDLYEGDPDNNRLDAAGNPIDGQEERRGGVPPQGTPFTGVPSTSDSGGFEAGSDIGFGYLIGQQYSLTGEPLTDRAGAPLTYKRDFLDGNGTPNLINNDETTGVRVQKYGARYGAGFTQNVVMFRYADAHLMKVEAILRGGSSGDDAAALLNDLRTIRGASPIATVDLGVVLDERGRELYMEMWRRNDLIRFGEYTRDWLFKSAGSVNNDQWKLFPLPAPQLLANPNLVQNPGY